MSYNPFSMIDSPQDIIELAQDWATNPISFGEPILKDPFMNYYIATMYSFILGYLWQEGSPKEQTMDGILATMFAFASDVHETTIDATFQSLAKEKPKSFAVARYHDYCNCTAPLLTEKNIRICALQRLWEMKQQLNFK